MENQSISQEYFICCTNEKGRMSVMNETESKAGLVASGILDLLINGIIEINNKKITVKKELPTEFNYLNSIYEYANSKTHSITKIIEDFCITFTDKRMNELINDIGESLCSIGAVEKAKGGITGNKTIYIPNSNYKETLVNAMRQEVLEKDNLNEHYIALVSLLKETKNLKQYFSKSENDDMKKKLKEIKNNPENKLIKDMVGYIDDVLTVIIAMVTMYH